MPDNRKTSLGIQLTDGSICEFIPPAPDATYRGGVTLEEKTKYDNYEGEINEIKEDLVNLMPNSVCLFDGGYLIYSQQVWSTTRKVGQPVSNGSYLEYKIRENDKYIKVSGCGRSLPEYRCYSIYDKDMNLLESYGPADNYIFNDVILKVPSNASVIYVNGTKDGINDPKLEVINIINIEDEITNSKYYAVIDSEILKGYIDGYNPYLVEHPDYYTKKISCNAGEKYKCTLIKHTDTTTLVNMYDNDNNFIKKIWGNDIGLYKDYEFSIPTNCTSFSVTSYRHYPIIKKLKYVDGNEFFKNNWCGKKIVCLGTSVMFGQYSKKSYIDEASKILGFNYINCAVPGLAIETLTDGGYREYGSCSLTVNEYANLGVTLDNAPKEYAPDGEYNSYYWSWEHIFTESNKDADLYLFGVIPNNKVMTMDDWNAFDKENWRYNDGSNFESHRSSFVGALLYMLDKLYKIDSDARICFVIDSTFQYDDGKEVLNVICDKYNIALIDLWGKINTIPASLSRVVVDKDTNLHPSEIGHEYMGKILAGALNSIF